jgi:DNA mismatch endonuclease (patch repair protein)
MVDVFSRAKRSEVMSRIKARDTKPERLTRSLLHRLGYRFRLHRAELPGTPDIVLPKYRAALFVHGCFWHRHPGCPFAYRPKSNVPFWRTKLNGNVRRDRAVCKQLGRLGWRVLTIWECQTTNVEGLERLLRALLGRR